ncbi:MAG: hypothetical protein ACYTG6_08445 [Planctomycetota bacterium]|jgi:cytochrome c5
MRTSVHSDTTCASGGLRHLAVFSAILVITACSWSVPANPGRNARLRSRDTGTDQVRTHAVSSATEAMNDAGAAEIYNRRCGTCHEPYPPTQVPAAQWPFFVNKYGPRAGLFGEERTRVLRWLQANSY